MSDNTVRGLLAEDEAPQRARLEKLLKETWPELDLVAVCASGTEAQQAARTLRPQVAFLDIRMPGVSGLDVARDVVAGGGHVAFITGYDQYAVDAFATNAVDYLLKPVDEARLAETVGRLRQRLSQGRPADMERLVETLRQALQPPPKDHIRWISATVGDSVRMVDVNDVLFFRASEKYVRVVTADDELVIRTPLKELAAGLDPEQFWQVHRSAIVRVAAMKKLRRNELGHYRLSLQGSREKLPVSAAAARRFRGM
ncbi:MAG TPA: LytTR family DNA-binding domain-containing protein [Wenzhouxiangella sp.]|nr:LytTR family DNA-binding domain-containing protein [Wenzhouxiangella sp.]